MKNADKLFALVKARADAVANQPPAEWEATLALIFDQHERASVDAGLTPEAALDMASRLDTWIREVLRLHPGVCVRRDGPH